MGRRKGFKQPHSGDLNRFASRGLGLEQGRMPEKSTDAMPGTREKAAVMMARLERGENPHHPLDARDRDDLPGVPPEEQCDAGYG